MDQNDLREMLANPYYAVVISKALSEEHEPLVSEEDWVKANAKLIEEIGSEEWLQRLLDTLSAK